MDGVNVEWMMTGVNPFSRSFRDCVVSCVSDPARYVGPTRSRRGCIRRDPDIDCS